MPTAPNVLLTARPLRNKPLSACVREASIAPILTHAQWPAHVSNANPGRKFTHMDILLATTAVVLFVLHSDALLAFWHLKFILIN